MKLYKKVVLTSIWSISRLKKAAIAKKTLKAMGFTIAVKV